MREIPALAEGGDQIVHCLLRAARPRSKKGARAHRFMHVETTMRWLCAALILLTGISAALADIRIDESRYVDGKLIIKGSTAPRRTVTLDRKYKTKSDGEGHFVFNIKKYKPSDCMSDIKAGSDVYSAVIAGCFNTGIHLSGAGMTPAKKHP